MLHSKGRVGLCLGVAVAALSLGFAPPALAQPAENVPATDAAPMRDAPYWNAALPVEQRVADLMARMTLEESSPR